MELPENIAVIYLKWPARPSIGGNVILALQKLGVHAEGFARNEEPDGFDYYIYVDQHPQEQKHPCAYWAIDMIVPQDAWRGNIDRYAKCAGRGDGAFAAHTDSIAYLASKGVEAQWLPLAANKDYHKPYPDEKIVYDVIGLYHNCQNRLAYSEAIRESGLRQLIGWREGKEYSRWMCRANCAINLSRSNELVLRVFEVMMMGVPLITDRCRDIDKLFKEGTHYLGHSSMNEMMGQVYWVKDHLEEARAMATRARALVLEKHTFCHRVLSIFGK